MATPCLHWNDFATGRYHAPTSAGDGAGFDDSSFFELPSVDDLEVAAAAAAAALEALAPPVQSSEDDSSEEESSDDDSSSSGSDDSSDESSDESDVEEHGAAREQTRINVRHCV